MPSEKLSATDSIAALMTPRSSRRSVSRPTMRPTAARASSMVAFSSCVSTLAASLPRSRIARHCQPHSRSSAVRKAGCTLPAHQRAPHEKASVLPVMASASSLPASSSPSGVRGKAARKNDSNRSMAAPMITTGCRIQVGSPSAASMTSAAEHRSP